MRNVPGYLESADALKGMYMAIGGLDLVLVSKLRCAKNFSHLFSFVVFEKTPVSKKLSYTASTMEQS